MTNNFNALLDEARTETFKFRVSKQLLFMSEVAARVQNVSLSAYIEALLSGDWPNVPLPASAQEDPYVEYVAGPGRERPFAMAHVAAALWDENDADRYIKQTDFPWSLKPEHQRLTELLRMTPGFQDAESFKRNVKAHWHGLVELVARRVTSDPELRKMLAGIDYEFVLMSERERIALYRTDKETFTERSSKYLEACKQGTHSK